MSLASIKIEPTEPADPAEIEVDREPTATTTMIISCTRIGCRRPVRPELVDSDESFLPLCDGHLGLLPGEQRWSVYSTQRGWLVDVRGIYTWDAEACRQWGTPETVPADLGAAGLDEKLSFVILGDGSSQVRTGLLVLRMR